MGGGLSVSACVDEILLLMQAFTATNSPQRITVVVFYKF